MKKRKRDDRLHSLLSSEEGRLARVITERLGLWHDVCIPADPGPQDEVVVKAYVGANVDVRAVQAIYTVDGSDPIDSSTAVCLNMMRTATVWSTIVWAYVEEFSCIFPAQPELTRVRYCIRASLSDGSLIHSPCLNAGGELFKKLEDITDRARIYHTYRRGAPMVYEYNVDREAPASWLHQAIIYQIVPDRFALPSGRTFSKRKSSDGPFGGTITGIIDKLDFLQELGINCLWLTPIFPGPSYHGYDCTAFNGIEPRLGTMDDWHRLVASCHERNIRILLDVAANHVSRDHPWFQCARGNQESRYRQWFRFTEWPDRYDCYAMEEKFPVLETEHCDVRKELIDACCMWLASGCDGFRLDHAHGLSLGFWSQMRTATRRVAPDSAMIGEVSDPPDRQLSYRGGWTVY